MYIVYILKQIKKIVLKIHLILKTKVHCLKNKNKKNKKNNKKKNKKKIIKKIRNSNFLLFKV